MGNEHSVAVKNHEIPKKHPVKKPDSQIITTEVIHTPSTRFSMAARNGDVEQAKKILEEFPNRKIELVNGLNEVFYPPVKLAILGDHVSFVAFLIENGLDIDKPIFLRRDTQFCPFKFALWNGKLSIALQLYEAGADITPRKECLAPMDNLLSSIDPQTIQPERVNKLAVALLSGGTIRKVYALNFVVTKSQDLTILFCLYNYEQYTNEKKEAAKKAYELNNPRLAQLIMMPINELKQTPEAIALIQKYPEILQALEKNESVGESKEEIAAPVSLGMFSSKASDMKQEGMADKNDSVSATYAAQLK